MKKITLLILFITNCFFAQNTFLEEFVSGIDSPRHLAINGDDLYVRSSKEVFVIDITAASPSTSVIYTMPTPNAGQGNGVRNFFISGTDIFILAETFDTVTDGFVKSEVIKIDLNNLATPPESILTDTSKFISNIAVIGNDLFFVSEVGNLSDSSLKKIDLTITNPPITSVIAGFEIIEDVAVAGNVIYLSDIDNTKVYSVDVSASTPVLSLVSDASNSINFIKGLYTDNNDLYICSGNEIKKSSLSATLPVTPSSIIANEDYEDTNNGTPFNANFRDVITYDGYAYMTLRNQGLIVRSELPVNAPCQGSGSVINEFATGQTYVGTIAIKDNDLYSASLSGISKFDLTTKTETTIYTANLNEYVFDFVIDGTIVYLSSSTFTDFEDGNLIESNIRKIDTNTGIVTTILTDTTSYIDGLELVSNDLYFASEEDSDTADGSDIDKIDITNNMVTDLGISYTFYVDDLLLSGSDFYFSDGNTVYKLPVSSINSTPTSFVTAETFIEGLTVDSGLLYFTDGSRIKRVLLTSTNTANDTEVMAINGTYNDIESDGSVYCSEFSNVVVKGDKIYSSMFFNNLIISAENEVVLSNEDFYNHNEKDITLVRNTNNIDVLGLSNFEESASVYSLLGQKLKTIKLSKNSSSFSTEALTNGVYILIFENRRSKGYKFMK